MSFKLFFNHSCFNLTDQFIKKVASLNHAKFSIYCKRIFKVTKDEWIILNLNFRRRISPEFFRNFSLSFFLILIISLSLISLRWSLSEFIKSSPSIIWRLRFTVNINLSEFLATRFVNWIKVQFFLLFLLLHTISICLFRDFRWKWLFLFFFDRARIGFFCLFWSLDIFRHRPDFLILSK